MTSTNLPLPSPGAIAVASLTQAAKAKRKWDAVITLEDPRCRPCHRFRFTKKPAPPQLILAFEDVDDGSLGVRCATADQVERAIAFGRDHVSSSLLVHCQHGIGRSAAIALAIITDRLGPGKESEAVDMLLALRPEVTPNLVALAHADQILGREGRLIAALHENEAKRPSALQRRQNRIDFYEANPELYAKARP